MKFTTTSKLSPIGHYINPIQLQSTFNKQLAHTRKVVTDTNTHSMHTQRIYMEMQ